MPVGDVTARTADPVKRFLARLGVLRGLAGRRRVVQQIPLDDIEVPYKPGDNLTIIKARMAKQMLAALEGQPAPVGRAAAGRFRPTMGRSSVRGKPISPTTGDEAGQPGPSGRLRLALPELVEVAEAVMQGKLVVKRP